MNDLSNHPAFKPVRQAHIKALDIDVHEYVHTTTGTPHIHLAADNPENVFLVGLRTIPTDSSGVAHILEHTVLCGSEKYPVRDPFFMMIRRSLNTFMNAFTSSDWTAYPFASQNRKDYFNLLDVYLDAVFFSRLDELDFAQEGHRLEFQNPDDANSPLEFKGVVFNEMKGAMSSPTSTLWQTMTKHLFPNNTYHHNSGGDPEAIPDLSYEQLLDFYKTHYHPSNAVFMTYGDIPAVELQQRMHDQVLQRFERLETTIAVNDTRRFYSPIRVEEAYAIQEEQTSDKTHIVVGWLLGKSMDLDQRLRAHLLSSVLLDNSASPLLRALEQSDLGAAPSPLCGLEDSTLDMVFVCGLDGSKPEHAQATENLVLETLAEVAKNGVPQAQVEAVLHQLELSQREIRGDGMPFGLQLVLSGLSTAMLRGDTLAAMDLDPALERLRTATEQPNFIQQTVQELFLDNPHRVTLTLRPDNAISERRNLAEKARLASIRSSLDDDTAQRIVEHARALQERQQQEDDPEILPKVTLADVPGDIRIPEADNTTLNGAPLASYSAGTNGLVYQHMVARLPAMNEAQRKLVPMYTSFLAEVGSGGRDYLATQQRHAAVTGSIGAYTLQRSAIGNEQDVSAYLVMRGKALLRNSDALAELLQELSTTARFDELPRLRELVAQTRMSREQSVTSSGHMFAMMAAASGMGPTAQLAHQTSGLAGIKALKILDDSLDDKTALAAFAGQLEELQQLLVTAPRQFMLIAEDTAMQEVTNSLQQAFNSMPNAAGFTAYQPEAVRTTTQQLWTTSTEVNFCARAYPTVTSAHEDGAALAVLGSFLRNGYLHRAIRENGGAYGGGATQDSDSASFRFYSYRDPRFDETLADFDKAISWLMDGSHDASSLEEAILNVVSSIDKPGSPSGEARSAFQSLLFGRGAEQQREFRQRILDVSLDDLRRAAERYLKPEAASTAVISSEALAAKNTSAKDLEHIAL